MDKGTRVRVTREGDMLGREGEVRVTESGPLYGVQFFDVYGRLLPERRYFRPGELEAAPTTIYAKGYISVR